MELPNLDSERTVVHIQGGLSDYIESLAPLHHHSNTVGVFDENANLCFQNEACRYFLEVGSSSAESL